MIKDYYYVTKPGIIRGNALTLIAGFMIASKYTSIDLLLLLVTLIGSCLVVAASCVLNNVIDRRIDKLMARTKDRALVKKRISVKAALIYASVLGLLGITILALFVNLLTAILGILGAFLYVVVYSYFKRQSSAGTLVGSLSGSLPPVAGYTAVANNIDSTAVVLFLSLACWQMAHFYAIAMYRQKDYKQAKVPVLPVVKGNTRTKISTLFYILAFAISCTVLYIMSLINEVSLIVFVLLASAWICYGLIKFNSLDNIIWGKNMFLMSLIAVSLWCLILSVNGLII